MGVNWENEQSRTSEDYLVDLRTNWNLSLSLQFQRCNDFLATKSFLIVSGYLMLDSEELNKEISVGSETSAPHQ